ncbi:MFS transporter [Pseudomonas sp. LS1212]|uniref:MFS transporter n=1 Tax=Pseudomonas sp. LS1212 TaxID=2972478 RepID=UPI00215BB6B1|nr:MFS transporter [Pseudomonas sp. LS1212]UVJ43132.1 MFS transporter [Pseudomonas sp. LS1212]
MFVDKIFGPGFALCYSMIQLVFAQHLWPRAMALVSAMWGVATLVGPAVGGVFAEMEAWRAAFGSLVPVTLAYLLLTWSILPDRDPALEQTGKLPIVQLFLLAAAVLAICAGSVSSQPVWNGAGIAVAGLLVYLLIRCESASEIRLLPRDALRPGAPLFTLYATIGLLIIGMTGEIFVPYFLQTLHGQTPLISGYLAALMAAGWTFSEVISSGWRENGMRRAIISGPLIVLIGLLLLMFTTPLNSAGDWLILGPLCLGLTLVGFGIGLGWPHLLTRVLEVAPPQDQDAAASSITTVQLFATAVGAALAGMIANLAGLNDPAGLEGTANAARWLFAAFALAPLLAILTALRAATITAHNT